MDKGIFSFEKQTSKRVSTEDRDEERRNRRPIPENRLRLSDAPAPGMKKTHFIIVDSDEEIKDRFEEMMRATLRAKELRKVNRSGHCPKCGKLSNAEVSFKDEISVKEFIISGLCQVCQDTFFQSDHHKRMQGLKREY